MLNLIFLMFLVRVEFADGSFVECEAPETVIYAPTLLSLFVQGCAVDQAPDDSIFIDGFEE